MKINTFVDNIAIILDGDPYSGATSILLGKKKPKKKTDEKRRRKKIGSGLWGMPGGGKKPRDKSHKHAVQREIREETHLRVPLRLFRKVVILKGYFDDVIIPNRIVHVYVAIVDKPWSICPGKEYEKLEWFPINRIPFNEMLQGDRDWLNRAIAGEKLMVEVFFGGDDRMFLRTVVRAILSFN